MNTLLKFFNRAAGPKPLSGRAIARSIQHAVNSLNRGYRDHLNPVRGLTMQRAVGLVESYARGEYADLMWTFGAPFMGIESADADLSALITCRTAPLLEMDWNALIVDKEGIDQKLAEEQQAFVRELMDGIDNLYAAIEHMALASFRGFAHCEMLSDPRGTLRTLNPVDPWYIVRDGSRGPWRYNPQARQTSYRSLTADLDIDPRTWLIREVPRPIHRVALVKFVREQLSAKDWDAFIEIYGIPTGIVIAPPDIPPDKEAEYSAAAVDISAGIPGSLPHGSSWVPNIAPRSNHPFAEHLKYLSEKLILAGTGGKLTMLNDATGLGSGNADAHQQTFETIARSEARQISELIQTQVVQPRLRAAFPDKPLLAYWQLAANEEVDVGQIVDQAVKLKGAGYAVEVSELAEKTGYRLNVEPEPQSPDGIADATALQNSCNALQNRLRASHGPTPPLEVQSPPAANFGGGVVAAKMSGLLTRIEAGEDGAVDEALELLSSLPPEGFDGFSGLSRALSRAATEAAVLGATGREFPALNTANSRNRGSTRPSSTPDQTR